MVLQSNAVAYVSLHSPVRGTETLLSTSSPSLLQLTSDIQKVNAAPRPRHFWGHMLYLELTLQGGREGARERGSEGGREGCYTNITAFIYPPTAWQVPPFLFFLLLGHSHYPANEAKCQSTCDILEQ